MNIKCFLGMHEWEKYGGADNVGGGRFKIRLICKRCRKIKSVIK